MIASVPDWLRVWAMEEYTMRWIRGRNGSRRKPCSTLSSKLLEMSELEKNALLVPSLCGEGSHDLRRLGNLHLQRWVTRSPARKSIVRTVWWSTEGLLGSNPSAK